MLSAFSNSLKIPELRQRILLTLGLVFICRLVASVPTPGVDTLELERVISEIESNTQGGFLSWVDLFSGGATGGQGGGISSWVDLGACREGSGIYAALPIQRGEVGPAGRPTGPGGGIL